MSAKPQPIEITQLARLVTALTELDDAYNATRSAERNARLALQLASDELGVSEIARCVGLSKSHMARLVRGNRSLTHDVVRRFVANAEALREALERK